MCRKGAAGRSRGRAVIVIIHGAELVRVCADATRRAEENSPNP